MPLCGGLVLICLLVTVWNVYVESVIAWCDRVQFTCGLWLWLFLLVSSCCVFLSGVLTYLQTHPLASTDPHFSQNDAVSTARR